MYSSTIQSSGHQHDPIIRSAGGIERFQYNIGWKTERVLLRIDAKHLLVWRIISTLKTSRSSSHNYIDNNITDIDILLCVNALFWHFGIFFSLPAAGLFACSRLRGTQGDPSDTGCKCRPWPRSAARALGFKVACPLGERFRARRAIQVDGEPRT